MSAPAGSELVLFIQGATVTLRNLTIDAEDTDVGIGVEGSSIELGGVVVEGGQGGLRLDGSSFAVVIDSEFDNDDVGVQVTGSSNAFLFRNTMRNNGSRGIVLNLNGSATIQENIIIGNGVGILVTKMSSAVLIDNLIENNTGPGIQIADQYGYVTTNGFVNTIQNNNPDVACEARGIWESPTFQVSTTSNTSILAGCTVLGVIFPPP